MSRIRIEVLGVPVDCLDMEHSLKIVDKYVHGDKSETVIAVNPEKVIKAREDPEQLASLRNASLLIPDGIGIVLAARLLGLCRMKRVPGCELMPEICNLSARKGYKIFLLGGRPEVIDKVASVLIESYKGIQIVGRQNGFFKESEVENIIERINASKAQVLFVAMGSPKQEQWMSKHLQKTHVKVCQGVGGTFDVISGYVMRAPLFFRKMHLEWLFRLLKDPHRLRRQTALPKFMYLVFMRKLHS